MFCYFAVRLFEARVVESTLKATFILSMKSEERNTKTINRSISYQEVDEIIEKHLAEIRSQEKATKNSSNAEDGVAGKAIGLLVAAIVFFMPVSAQSEIGWQGGTVYDFGEIKEQKGTVAHTFVFKNNGDAPFSITNVRTSCGCTSAVSTGKIISPADTAHVTVCFNPTNVEGFFHQRIVVYTNSPARQNSLFIKGKVKPRKEKNDISKSERGLS